MAYAFEPDNNNAVLDPNFFADAVESMLNPQTEEQEPFQKENQAVLEEVLPEISGSGEWETEQVPKVVEDIRIKTGTLEQIRDLMTRAGLNDGHVAIVNSSLSTQDEANRAVSALMGGYFTNFAKQLDGLPDELIPEIEQYYTVDIANKERDKTIQDVSSSLASVAELTNLAEPDPQKAAELASPVQYSDAQLEQMQQKENSIV